MGQTVGSRIRLPFPSATYTFPTKRNGRLRCDLRKPVPIYGLCRLSERAAAYLRSLSGAGDTEAPRRQVAATWSSARKPAPRESQVLGRDDCPQRSNRSLSIVSTSGESGEKEKFRGLRFLVGFVQFEQCDESQDQDQTISIAQRMPPAKAIRFRTAPPATSPIWVNSAATPATTQIATGSAMAATRSPTRERRTSGKLHGLVLRVFPILRPGETVVKTGWPSAVPGNCVVEWTSVRLPFEAD